MNRLPSSPPSTSTILLADDDPNDRELISRAFRKSGRDVAVHALNRAHQVIDYLKGHGPYADRTKYPPPNLLILDLSLLVSEEWEPLTWIRSQTQFDHLPVIILSGSELPGHRQKTERLGANVYIQKPHSFEEMVAELKRLLEFWIRIPI